MCLRLVFRPLHSRERVHLFVRELTFSIRSCVLMVVKQGVSFKSIMSTAKDNIKGVWRDQEGTLFLSLNGASYGGKGSHRGDSSFQHHRLVHASMPAAKSGQPTRVSYGSHRGDSSFQHHMLVHANFGILLIFRTRGVQGRYLG